MIVLYYRIRFKWKLFLFETVQSDQNQLFRHATALEHLNKLA